MLRKLRVNPKHIFSAAAPLVLACLVYLIWLNHNNFVSTVLSGTEEQLLMITTSEAQSIERHPVNIQNEKNEILRLVQHVEKAKNVYVLVLDNTGTTVINPDPKQVGKNMRTLLQERFKGSDLLQAEKLIDDMISGKEGATVTNFFSEDVPSKIVKTIVAYSPLQKEGKTWSLAVLREFGEIKGPIDKDLRDNLILLSLVLLTLSLGGLAFFRYQKKNYKLEVSVRALEIINRQLRLENTEYQRVEKELYQSLKVEKTPAHSHHSQTK